jgi:hypothetical protein
MGCGSKFWMGLSAGDDGRATRRCGSAESLDPGATVADVARRNDVAQSVLFSWWRQARLPDQAPPVMVLLSLPPRSALLSLLPRRLAGCAAR